MNKKPEDRIGKGKAGKYTLNQKFQVFADRRTRRNRTRSEQERNARNEQTSE